MLDQRGGVYYGTPKTQLILEAEDALASVANIEVSINNAKYIPYQPPLQLWHQ